MQIRVASHVYISTPPPPLTHLLLHIPYIYNAHELHSALFNEAVSVDDYPEYYDMVDEPMDFGSIYDRLEGGQYGSSGAAVMDDLELVWSNCITFNADGSEIADLALQNKRQVLKLVEKAKLMAGDGGGVGGGGDGGGGKRMCEDGVGQTAAMQKVLDELSDLAFAGNFLDPVPLAVFSDYSDLIETPMDVAAVQGTLDGGGYHGSSAFSAFVADLDLIWENCVAYNLPGSEIVSEAQAVHAALDVLLSTHLGLSRPTTPFPTGFSMPKGSSAGKAGKKGPMKDAKVKIKGKDKDDGDDDAYDEADASPLKKKAKKEGGKGKSPGTSTAKNVRAFFQEKNIGSAAAGSGADADAAPGTTRSRSGSLASGSGGWKVSKATKAEKGPVKVKGEFVSHASLPPSDTATAAAPRKNIGPDGKPRKGRPPKNPNAPPKVCHGIIGNRPRNAQF